MINWCLSVRNRTKSLLPTQECKPVLLRSCISTYIYTYDIFSNLGYLERGQQTQHNIIKVVSKLVELLAANGKLSEEEVCEILDMPNAINDQKTLEFLGHDLPDKFL